MLQSRRQLSQVCTRASHMFQIFTSFKPRVVKHSCESKNIIIYFFLKYFTWRHKSEFQKSTIVVFNNLCIRCLFSSTMCPELLSLEHAGIVVQGHELSIKRIKELCAHIEGANAKMTRHEPLWDTAWVLVSPQNPPRNGQVNQTSLKCAS